MFGKSITADFPQSAGNNPGELMEQMKEDGLAFTKKVLSRQNDPEASNQQMVDSDAEADEEVMLKRSAFIWIDSWQSIVDAASS